MRLAPPSADRIRDKRRQDWETTHPILLDQEKSLPRLFMHYIQGGGSQADHLVITLRKKIDDIAAAQHFTPRGESVFDQYGRIVPAYLKQLCPAHAEVFFDIGSYDDIAKHELFAESANEHNDMSLPPPINMVLQQSQRPAFRAYAMRDAALYVSPVGYQMFSAEQNCFWPSASSRTFSKLVTTAPVLRIADHIVIVQDRFPGENFAHFLFDWITRLGLFLESGLAPVRDCVFVMGGIPDEFRTLLLRAVTAAYGVEPAQFFFPEDGLNLRTEGNIYWFSDQTETYMHPAQMAHSRSIEVIKRISSSLPIAGARFERIYISRGDTGRRRVSNEHDVWRRLCEYGFEMIRLADHRVEDQIALMRGARQVVAPHGMGLTHLALHGGQPTLLELFNRESGGDDYALISKAMRFPYSFVLGEPVRNGYDDFSISPDAVLAALDKSHLRRVVQVANPKRNLIPTSSSFGAPWHPGWQDEKATPTTALPPLHGSNVVMRHVRMNPDVQKDTNTGAWSGIPVQASRIYTASCWVWIAREFTGNSVGISIGEWGMQNRHLADLSIRNSWQRVCATATSPWMADSCNVVIRVGGPHGSVVYSTCWQLEAGPVPTDYRQTP